GAVIQDGLESRLALAQRLFPLLALDHLGGLPGVEVGQIQLAQRRTMWPAKVRREHAQRRSVAAEQRGGLYGTKPRGGGDPPVRREARIGQDVLDEDALPWVECPA